MRENLLIDSLPETIWVDGREFSISTNFRTGILFELLIYDNEVPPEQKVEQIFDLYFGDSEEMPPRTKETIDAVLAFYRCERQQNVAAKRLARREKEKSSPKRIYDYDHDAAYIYAAFLQDYGIDLNDIEYLHWWKFSALFSALRTDTKISEIMGYRAADISKIKSKSEKERMIRLKAIYGLPNPSSREDKIAHAANIFAGGMK